MNETSKTEFIDPTQTQSKSSHTVVPAKRMELFLVQNRRELLPF